MSMLSVDNAKGTVIELNSLSKSHNMAGWRIGVLCGTGPQIDEVLRFKSNMDSGMFLPMQLAAARALELGEDWFTSINQVYAKRRALVMDLLKQVGCVPAEGQAGMFVWAAIPNGYDDAYALSDRILYEAGVFLTPGGIFGTAGEQYIRVSLCSPVEKIQEAIIRIKTALS
jgi:aspartate/methionine/tyrosine aminotransferase